MSDQKETYQPFISSSQTLPEITVKAVVLGIILSVVLGAANAYLGLFAGMTVSASIPAAVISMAVLSLFRNSNVLENNIVQTAASAGEGVAVGVIFTVPALILIDAWTEFNYWETTLISGFGGILGVLFSIPLRRALIVESPLQYPEGVATAEILKAGDTGGEGVKLVAKAGIAGALFKFCETGLKFWHGAVEAASGLGKSVVYFGSNLSPALIGVGFIVGLNIACLIFIGGFINWFIFIPILTAMNGGIPVGTSAVDAASTMWATQTRYLGVGAMMVGGIWALIRLRKSLVRGIKSGLAAYRNSKSGGNTERTDRDMPMQWIGIATAISVVPLFLIFEYFTGQIALALFMTLIMLVSGFLFSSVAGYMAGLVGSSNNPVSGVTIATILTAALLLLAWLGTGSSTGPVAAIFIGSVVAAAAAIAGDNLQDLKAGRVLGATPVKQQIMQLVGVIVAAFVIAPILTLLLHAYGIGEPTAAHPNPLAAPQATLMAAVAEGVFGKGLPWPMVGWGMFIAVAVILLDLLLEKKGSNFRTHVLAVAVGIYLPFELEVPILIGGLLAWFVSRTFAKATTDSDGKKKEKGMNSGLLFSAGLITGEAMVGILMAIPIVIYGRDDIFAFAGVRNWNVIGILILAVILFYLFKLSVRPLSENTGMQE